MRTMLTALMLMVASAASSANTISADYDWRLAGEVVSIGYAGEEDYYFVITIRRSWADHDGDEYLDVVCERPTKVFTYCETVELFDYVDMKGRITSNEPHSGHRLSVRKLRIEPGESACDIDSIVLDGDRIVGCIEP